jgi:glucosamine-6-phosphate deaminase
MTGQILEAKSYRVGTLKVEVHPSGKAAGVAAARAAGHALVELGRSRDSIGVIFATGASQLDTLEALTKIANLPWNKVSGFHLDEYIGISGNHFASFQRYLREKLTDKVPMKEFFAIDGCVPDIDKACQEYVSKLRSADPQLCLLGIGENGHLAFNDPPVANFSDDVDIKVVQLDDQCRQQQTAEGWFSSVEQVPESAITLTIPALFRVPKLILSVPGARKAKIIRRTFEDPVSTECPATILRTHPDATIYLDPESASELDGLVLS